MKTRCTQPVPPLKKAWCRWWRCGCCAPVRQALARSRATNHDQEAGIKLVLKAIEAPLREIVANAGGEPSVVVNAILAGKGNYGFNAANDTYGDMIENGHSDPTKVTRTALQNAASVQA